MSNRARNSARERLMEVGCSDSLAMCPDKSGTSKLTWEGGPMSHALLLCSPSTRYSRGNSMKVGRATMSENCPTLTLLAAIPGCSRSQRVRLGRGYCKLLLFRGQIQYGRQLQFRVSKSLMRLRVRAGPDFTGRTQSKDALQALPSWSGDYSPGDVLGDKYQVKEVLGRGSNGVTYKAIAPDGREVAVKALSLRRMADWKQLELFEREAKILESLAHPGIPQYIDYFEEDSEKDRGFFLVQELAQGKSLAKLIEGGVTVDESEAKRIASQVLGILNYLGSRRPPVVHRDVKPENIVLEDGKADGRVFLVDFGGVQAAAAGESFALGSTVIGTYGYMAPEQFRGAAQPASDLYSLGGTLLYLLSGRPPNSFPQERMQISFRDIIDVSPELAAVLDGLLEPLVEDRMSAADAMAILTGQTTGRSLEAEEQPPGARVRIRERRDSLRIDVPPASMNSPEKLGLAGFAVTWNVGIGVWTASALAAGSLAAAAFSIPFWAAGFSVARDAFRSSFSEERVEIGPKRWSITRLGRFSNKEDGSRPPTTEGKTRDLKGVQVVVTGYVNGLPRTELKLIEGFREHRFGAGLSTMEQQWLATRMTSHLQSLPGQPAPEVVPTLSEQSLQPYRDSVQRDGGPWSGDPTWGPYWGPTGNGIYEANIAWEEDAERQKQQLQAASSNKDEKNNDEPWSVGGTSLELSARDLSRDELGLVSDPDDSAIGRASDSHKTLPDS